MKNIIAFVAAFLILPSLKAQTYQDAIKLLKENKRTESAAILRELQKSNDKADASLALAMIELTEGHEAQAFKDFEIFYENHPNPYPYVYALYNSGIFSTGNAGNNEEVIDFFEKLMSDPRANCTVQSCAIDILGWSMERQGDFEAAKKIFDNLHDIKNWSTVGVFENVSGSGFNKDAGPVLLPWTYNKFTNKTGATVQWYDIPTARNDHWWDMSYLYDVSDAIVYTQTFISSEEDKDVLLMTGVSGSVKIWLNDLLVASVSDERNTDEDVYTYRVRLQKGVNRLLLQLGSSEIKKNNFLVRIADTAGSLVKDLKSTSTFQPYAKAAPYEIKQVPFFAETYFEKEVARQPDNFINQVMLLSVYNHNEKKYEAHKVLAKLKEMAPSSTLVAGKAIETAKIDDNIVEETKEKEFIKTNDPESLLGIGLRYVDAFAKENWDEATSIIDKRDSLYGESVTSEIERINILSKKKDFERVGAEINTAYDKYPDNEKIVELKYQKLLQQNKDFHKSRPILDKFLKDHYSVNIIDIIVSADLKTGDKNEAIDLLQKDIYNDPIAVVKYLQLVNICYEIHQFSNAMDWVKAALKQCPYNGYVYYMQGMIYCAQKDIINGKEMMKKAVYYSPTYYQAREKLRLLENKKSLFDLFKQNDVTRLYKDALANEKYAKEEGVVILNDKRQIVYPENGAGEEQVEMLVYINSQTAINQFKEYYIQHNFHSQKLIIDKAELLKKDGNKVPAEKQNGYCVFSSLGIGDAIHISYKLENSYQGKLAEHFWSETYFNNVYPTQTSRYSIIVPVNKKFDFKVTPKDAKPVVNYIDDYTMYTWEENDIPKIATEPLATSDIYDKITVSSIPDWSYVANWYSDISNIKTKADFEVKEKVKELMAFNEKLPDIEKARIIYNYIENNYNYSSVPFLHSAFTPQSSSRTMSTKLGDCKDLSTLFVSMAREAGLNANLVLVRTKGSGDDNLELPTISFNHCIAQLHASDKNYLIELTNNHLSFAAMGSHIINANGLFIPKDGESITDAKLVKLNTQDRPQNSIVRSTKISFNGDQAVIHRVVYKIGAEAATARGAYKDKDEEDKKKYLTGLVSTELNKNIKIENLNFENLKNLSDSIIYNYDLKVDNFSNEIVGMKVFRIPWTDAHFNEQMFSLDKRKYPLDFEYYTSTPAFTETISIDLPAGKKLAETPKDVVITSPAISYSVKYQVKDNKLVAVREIKYLKDIIMPEEYEGVKDIIAKINQADSKDIAMK